MRKFMRLDLYYYSRRSTDSYFCSLEFSFERANKKKGKRVTYLPIQYRTVRYARFVSRPALVCAVAKNMPF